MTHRPKQDPKVVATDFPSDFFGRADETSDDAFYRDARFVTHVDNTTIEALTKLYSEMIPSNSDVLDLMSSWVSHLPVDIDYKRVIGLGMNRQELANNSQLDDFVIHDLNAQPELSLQSSEFDFVLNAFSVQYLTQPAAVFSTVARLLRPGGISIVAFSHRMFPTKAIKGWQHLNQQDRIRLVGSYHVLANDFEEPIYFDRSPEAGDPLWVVAARKHDPGVLVDHETD